MSDLLKQHCWFSHEAAQFSSNLSVYLQFILSKFLQLKLSETVATRAFSDSDNVHTYGKKKTNKQKTKQNNKNTITYGTRFGKLGPYGQIFKSKI